MPKVEDHWARQCGILDISQPYGAPRPATGIALLCLHFESGNQCQSSCCVKTLYCMRCGYRSGRLCSGIALTVIRYMFHSHFRRCNFCPGVPLFSSVLPGECLHNPAIRFLPIPFQFIRRCWQCTVAHTRTVSNMATLRNVQATFYILHIDLMSA
jgi:hypothetical protein